MRQQHAPVWRKASGSDGHGACVEIAALEDVVVGVRDSKDPQGIRFVLNPTAWTTFLIHTMAGHFDL